MSSKINDKTLYFRMKQKDKEAFISAYDSYLNDIYRFIYFKVGNREEAEDLTSSVFLKTWNYIQDNNLKSYKTLKALLYRIARNAVIDHYRQKSKRQDISYDAELGFDVEDEKQDNLQKMEMIDSFAQKLSLLRYVSQPVMAVFLIAGVLLGGGFFSLNAAKDTKPGDSLYIAKIISEKTQFALTFNEKKKVKLGIEFAGNRAKEITQVLSEEGDVEIRVEKLKDNFKKQHQRKTDFRNYR